jgi:hypothetical protein
LTVAGVWRWINRGNPNEDAAEQHIIAALTETTITATTDLLTETAHVLFRTEVEHDLREGNGESSYSTATHHLVEWYVDRDLSPMQALKKNWRAATRR